MSEHKELLVIPAAVLGLSVLPMALREGASFLSNKSASAADSMLNRLVDRSETSALSAKEDLGKELSKHFPQMGATESSTSISHSLEPILPHYTKEVPNSWVSAAEKDNINLEQKYSPGHNIVDWVNIDGEYRSFMTHVPKSFNPDQPSPLVVALDGFLVKPKNPYAGMASAGGMIEQSDKLGFIAVFPVPKPRYGDRVFTWNEPSGSTNFMGIHPHSDTDYIQRAMDKVMTEIPIDRSRVYAVGFSQGSLQLHDLVAKSAPGTFKAVATIAGTTTDNIGLPPAGTKLLTINSEGDPILRHQGGVGWLPRMFDKMTWNFASLSKPQAQIQKYLEANGIDGAPTIAKLPDLTVKTWNNADGETFAQELVLNKRYGHTIPGSIVDPTETFFSVLNGIAADKSILNAKTWITEDFFKLAKKPA